MKRISFALAVVAAVSMVVTPVAPSYGASLAREARTDAVASAPAPSTQRSNATAQAKAEHRQAIAAHAERGDAAILSKAQMDRLGTTHPKLHAKLMTAYTENKIPDLTATEKKLVDTMTAANLEEYKAGGLVPVHGLILGGSSLAAGGWFVIGFIIIVLVLILLNTMNPGIVARFFQSLFSPVFYR